MYTSCSACVVCACLLHMNYTVTQGVTLEEHSVECVTSSDKLVPPAVSSGGVVKLMSFTTFSAASVKSKVRFYLFIS